MCVIPISLRHKTQLICAHASFPKNVHWYLIIHQSILRSLAAAHELAGDSDKLDAQHTIELCTRLTACTFVHWYLITYQSILKSLAAAHELAGDYP